jgi:hypothetical protein
MPEMTLDLVTLSAYSTAATAIATIFLVGVTAFLVLATIQLTNTTKQLTDITKEMWLAQDRPLLYFYIVKQESGFAGASPIPTRYLYVKNIGKGPALGIRFNVDVVNQHSPQEIIALSPHEERKIIGLPNTHGEVHISGINYTDINEIPKNPPDADLLY